MTNLSQPPSTAWTEARIGRLVALWTARLSAAQIARQLGDGLTRSAVVGKLCRMGLTRDAGERHDARAEGARLSRRKQKPADGPDRLPKFEGAPAQLNADEGDVFPRLIGILNLRKSTCRWPYESQGETRYCGHSTEGSGPYCPAHRRRAYEAALPALSDAQIEALVRRNK